MEVKRLSAEELKNRTVPQEPPAFFSKQERCDLRNNAITLWHRVANGEIPNWGVRSQRRDDGGSLNEAEIYSLISAESLKIVFGLSLKLIINEFYRPGISSGIYERRLTFNIDASDPGPDGWREIVRQHDIYFLGEFNESKPDIAIGRQEFSWLNFYVSNVSWDNPGLIRACDRLAQNQSPVVALAERLGEQAVASQVQ